LRIGLIIALSEEESVAGGPCYFCYLLSSALFCIIFIWIGDPPNPAHFPDIIIFIIMHVACVAAKMENNIYLF